jgi:hypothetical protein
MSRKDRNYNVTVENRFCGRGCTPGLRCEFSTNPARGRQSTTRPVNIRDRKTNYSPPEHGNRILPLSA